MSNINKKNTSYNGNSIGITSQTVNDIITYVDNNKKEKVILLLNKINKIIVKQNLNEIFINLL